RLHRIFAEILSVNYCYTYEATALECYQSRFYAYGVFGLLEEWIKRGFKETPEEMEKLFFKVMDDRNGI
ncbi:MAG: TetR-like C-terminal domain-containing protein, partial [Acutalibacteraceae bacterium]